MKKYEKDGSFNKYTENFGWKLQMEETLEQT
jgi:hypothetical protein